MNDEQVYDFGIRLRQLREDRGHSRVIDHTNSLGNTMSKTPDALH